MAARDGMCPIDHLMERVSHLVQAAPRRIHQVDDLALGARPRWRTRNGYAARTLTRNFSTADFRWALSLESDRADCKTCVDAEPVWTEPWLTLR
jgi:hypothetical protein